MSTTEAEDYVKRAEECLRLAGACIAESNRQILIYAAVHWRMMAEEAAGRRAPSHRPKPDEATPSPSACLARGFESCVDTTTTGDAVTGVLKSEGDAIVLVLVDGQERSIPRADVADMQPGTISLMPPGFAEQLSRQELADLLAFLKGTRWGA